MWPQGRERKQRCFSRRRSPSSSRSFSPAPFESYAKSLMFAESDAYFEAFSRLADGMTGDQARALRSFIPYQRECQRTAVLV